MKIHAGLTLVAMMAVVTATAAFAQGPGAETFKTTCAMCHGADGLASTAMAKAMKIPPFNSPELVKATDAQLIAVVTNGKQRMPAFADKLTAEQIKDVVAYIRTLQK